MGDGELPAARLFVQRAKDGRNAPHPLQPDEVAALKALWKAEGKPASGPVFASERLRPFSRDGINKLVERLRPFSRDGINKLVERLGRRAGIAWGSFRMRCGIPRATSW